MERNRLFPWSGIVFVALVVGTAAGTGDTPASGAPASEVASFYGDNAMRQGIGAFLLAASVPFLVFFGIGLASALGSGSVWTQVLVGGTILVGATVLVAAFVRFALVDGGDNDVSPTALEALNVLDGNTWVAFIPALGVMMLGAAGVLLSAGVLRWLGWTALVLGIVLFVPIAGFFAMLLTAVWIVVTGIALARLAERPYGARVATAK